MRGNSPAEVNELINVLNAGALEVPLITEPISELTISPTLGLDVQQKGMTAIFLSSILVYIFMLIYYRFSGLVADICVTLNLLLLFGSMAVIDSAFTLPGLAGIALTIGIAVDSNVLIYERMREELERGSSLRMAIKNGFDRAFSAIIDSNVTTLISAVILYMIGTDQIRGFAVTLFIGLVVSLFTVLYFGRMMFEIAERKRWITKLKMMKLLGHTDFDFIGKQKYCWCRFGRSSSSAAWPALRYRGDDNYDVDLSGGTMVTFQFTKPQNISQVRQKLEKQMGGISLERLTLPGERQTGDEGKQFRVRTKEQDLAQGPPEGRFRRSDRHGLAPRDDDVRHRRRYPDRAAGKKRRGRPVRRDQSRFAGGHESDSEVQLGDHHGHGPRLAHLGRSQQGSDGYGKARIEQASNLVEFVGIAGQGVKPSGAVQVKRFYEMQLKTTAGDSRGRRAKGAGRDGEDDGRVAGLRPGQHVRGRRRRRDEAEGRSGFGPELHRHHHLPLVPLRAVVYGLALILAVHPRLLARVGHDRRRGLLPAACRVHTLPGTAEFQDRHGHDRRVHDDRGLFAQRYDRRLRPAPRNQGQEPA